MIYSIFIAIQVTSSVIFLGILIHEVIDMRTLNKALKMQLAIIMSLKEDYEEMEKYGADFSTLPVDDDQVKELDKIASDLRITYKMPANKAEAQKLIEKLKEKEKAE